MRKAAMLISLAGCGTVFAPALHAQTTPDSATAGAAAQDSVESLRKQLAAQQAINRQLRDRVQQLEEQLAAAGGGKVAPVLSLDVNAPPPQMAREPEVNMTAIEQAMVGKGLVLLPQGVYRFTPSLTWAHSGHGNDRRDSYFYGLSLDAGLPWGMAGWLSVPYVQRDYPEGHNYGLGDISVGLSKVLSEETATRPSWVAHLSYLHDNGKDPFAPVPVGNGFQTLSASLSAVKRVDPLVLYGELSYSHAWSKTATFLNGGTYTTARIAPADDYGLSLGVSLAATPDVSLDAGLSLDVRGKNRIAPVTGDAYWTAGGTAGYFNLGAGFVLRKNLYLNLSAAAGVTSDATDLIVSAELPYYF